MPDQNGIFKRLERWVARQAAGATNNAIEWDADGDDVASALNNRIFKDGTNTPTADIPFAGHSLTGIRPAVAAGEPMEFAQASALISASGGSTANAIHNGSFIINQRALSGTIVLAAAAYGHDRWKAGASGASYAIGAVGADNQATVGSGSLQQIISSSDVVSATMTLSHQGSAQARVYAQGSAQPSFATCPITVTNLTPGAPAIVEFSTGTVLQPQLEAGSSAHAFSRRSVFVEYILCQAFYEVMPFRVVNTIGNSNTEYATPLFFRSIKNTVPSATITVSANASGTAVTAINISKSGLTLDFNGAIVVGVTGTVAASCEP